MAETIGIIGAMETEVKMLQNSLQNMNTTEAGGLTFYSGNLGGKNVVVVKSGVGKVNAALCAQRLILQFGATKVINTGIAGAAGEGLEIFDFVASSEAVYHDVNVEIFGYAKGQIPGLDLVFKADETLADKAVAAFNASEFAKEHKIVKGRVASGDQFIAEKNLKDSIISNFAPMCVEMEGAAIAHACTINKVPFVILRSLSDCADDSANCTYSFNEDTAADMSAKVVLKLIELI